MLAASHISITSVYKLDLKSQRSIQLSSIYITNQDQQPKPTKTSNQNQPKSNQDQTTKNNQDQPKEQPRPNNQDQPRPTKKSNQDQTTKNNQDQPKGATKTKQLHHNNCSLCYLLLPATAKSRIPNRQGLLDQKGN